MSRPIPKPYEWKRSQGVVPAWLLRDYATWLFPQLGLKWEAKGVTDFSKSSKRKSSSIKPYQFPRSTGVMRLRELRHMAAYVLGAFGSAADKNPYQWPRMSGLAFVPDLMSLAEYFQSLLDQQRKKDS